MSVSYPSSSPPSVPKSPRPATSSDKNDSLKRRKVCNSFNSITLDHESACSSPFPSLYSLPSSIDSTSFTESSDLSSFIEKDREISNNTDDFPKNAAKFLDSELPVSWHLENFPSGVQDLTYYAHNCFKPPCPPALPATCALNDKVSCAFPSYMEPPEIDFFHPFSDLSYDIETIKPGEEIRSSYTKTPEISLLKDAIKYVKTLKIPRLQREDDNDKENIPKEYCTYRNYRTGKGSTSLLNKTNQNSIYDQDGDSHFIDVEDFSPKNYEIHHSNLKDSYHFIHSFTDSQKMPKACGQVQVHIDKLRRYSLSNNQNKKLETTTNHINEQNCILKSRGKKLELKIMPSELEDQADSKYMAAVLDKNCLKAQHYEVNTPIFKDSSYSKRFSNTNDDAFECFQGTELHIGTSNRNESLQSEPLQKPDTFKNETQFNMNHNSMNEQKYDDGDNDDDDYVLISDLSNSSYMHNASLNNDLTEVTINVPNLIPNEVTIEAENVEQTQPTACDVKFTNPFQNRPQKYPQQTVHSINSVTVNSKEGIATETTTRTNFDDAMLLSPLTRECEMVPDTISKDDFAFRNAKKKSNLLQEGRLLSTSINIEKPDQPLEDDLVSEISDTFIIDDNYLDPIEELSFAHSDRHLKFYTPVSLSPTEVPATATSTTSFEIPNPVNEDIDTISLSQTSPSRLSEKENSTNFQKSTEKTAKSAYSKDLESTIAKFTCSGTRLDTISQQRQQQKDKESEEYKQRYDKDLSWPASLETSIRFFRQNLALEQFSSSSSSSFSKDYTEGLKPDSDSFSFFMFFRGSRLASLCDNNNSSSSSSKTELDRSSNDNKKIKDEEEEQLPVGGFSLLKYVCRQQNNVIGKKM